MEYMNKVILLVFCHLVGDYVLQNDFIAKTKGSNWYHLFVHCALYCLPFLSCLWINLAAWSCFFDTLYYWSAKGEISKNIICNWSSFALFGIIRLFFVKTGTRWVKLWNLIDLQLQLKKFDFMKLKNELRLYPYIDYSIKNWLLWMELW